MVSVFSTRKALLLLGTAASALSAAALPAMAGGFEVREQSAYYQGMSFAGVAAGGSSLSSIFWNPATSSFVGEGLTTNSNYSLILPRADVKVENVAGMPTPGGPYSGPCSPLEAFGADCEVDVGEEAIVPASYAAYRISNKLVAGLAMNSQFGLGTEPDNNEWIGAPLASQSSKLFSINLNPSVSYEVMPGVSIGAGVQVQYTDLKRLKTLGAADLNGDGLPETTGTLTLKGDDVGIGWNIGINVKPAAGTSIGIGYRSSIDHKLEGKITANGDLGAALGGAGILPASISANLETPDKLTGSIRQDLTDRARLFATVEWTNWSKLGTIPVDGAPSPTELLFEWEDGWYFALGGEYDYSEKLTLRAGGAYEISPIQKDTSRLVQLPDADRIWASVGASYDVGNLLGMGNSTIDFAYSHVFVEGADFNRHPSSSPGPVYTGSTDSAVDVVSLGMTTKW